MRDMTASSSPARSAGRAYLRIQDDTIEILDAGDYWGKGTEEVTAALKAKHGKDHRTLVIGPAAEKLVKYSIILNDGHHATGRAGFGAIMGSKNLKAIVVKASKKDMEAADRASFESYRKELNKRLVEAVPAAVMHEDGTAANLTGGVYSGDVPVKNWQSNFWEESADALAGSTLSEMYLTKRRRLRLLRHRLQTGGRGQGGTVRHPGGTGAGI